ncbi:hypothetical protein GCM10010977_32610 [Citricoccus zhacaiensis]|uniref:Uncharacterized protein n=1 Tax=Citricoccus zhacaiensis TaxID=489142 RepID=A0ABQ2MDF0_9MICC|nr:hypothetical protein GCM10010977_32610 [Citricoccus zhacaiensis]VXC20422.1 hypothetical protein CITRIK5_80056 [Citricoccus sp. K5]
MSDRTLPLAATGTAAEDPSDENHPAGSAPRARARCRGAAGAGHTRAVQLPAPCHSAQKQSSDERRPR